MLLRDLIVRCGRWRGWVRQGDECGSRQLGPWIAYYFACPCDTCTDVHGELLAGRTFERPDFDRGVFAGSRPVPLGGAA